MPEGWLLKLSRLLQNFETAVRENVTINGQPWEETSDDSELQSGMGWFPLISCWVVLASACGIFNWAVLPPAVCGGKDAYGAGKVKLQLRCALKCCTAGA